MKIAFLLLKPEKVPSFSSGAWLTQVPSLVMPMNFSHVESVPEPFWGRYTLIAPALPPTCDQFLSRQPKMALSWAVSRVAGARLPPDLGARTAQVIASLASVTYTTPCGPITGVPGLRPLEERPKSRQNRPVLPSFWFRLSALRPAPEPSGRAVLVQPALGTIENAGFGSVLP